MVPSVKPPLQSLTTKLLVVAQSVLARADFAPTYDRASDVLVMAGHKPEITYPKRTYVIESHDGWLPELKYEPYSGGYTRGLIATLRRGNGFLQKTKGIGFLCYIGSRKDRTQGIGYKDYGPDARRVSQLGEPQFKLPL